MQDENDLDVKIANNETDADDDNEDIVLSLEADVPKCLRKADEEDPDRKRFL